MERKKYLFDVYYINNQYVYLVFETTTGIKNLIDVIKGKNRNLAYKKAYNLTWNCCKTIEQNLNF